MTPATTFQDLIQRLNDYWAAQGCVLIQPLDLEVGAGTFHPATFLRALGPEPWNAAYVQPCRRPTDGRYGENPNRLQRYYQYQVVMKPNPDNIQELYLGSLQALGIDPLVHDLRFVEDNWESPTLGAWGLGWEVWLNGMEVTQFTYFQQAGGLECRPVLGEITYGLERLCMYLQNVDNVFDLVWTARPAGRRSPTATSTTRTKSSRATYNFEHADVAELFHRFDACEAEALKLVELGLPLPAYEQVCKASHCFNLLDARRAISVTERQRYILRVRKLSQAVAEAYYAQREKLGFPGVKCRPRSANRHEPAAADARRRAAGARGRAAGIAVPFAVPARRLEVEIYKPTEPRPADAAHARRGLRGDRRQRRIHLRRPPPGLHSRRSAVRARRRRAPFREFQRRLLHLGHLLRPDGGEYTTREPR